jgi:hypothetical protein
MLLQFFILSFKRDFSQLFFTSSEFMEQENTDHIYEN